MKIVEMEESLVNGSRGGNGTAKVKNFEDSLNKFMMLTLTKVAQWFVQAQHKQRNSIHIFWRSKLHV